MSVSDQSILKEALPRSVDAQYDTGDQWRNNSRKNEETEAKHKQHPVRDVTEAKTMPSCGCDGDVTGDGSKVRCCKQQYCIGTWNVRSMIQGKLEVAKRDGKSEHPHLAISELKGTGMGEFNSDDHHIYYCGQETVRRNGVAIIVNKRVQTAILGCSLKKNRMISDCFQGKPFNITVIQVCAPTSNAKEAE